MSKIGWNQTFVSFPHRNGQTDPTKLWTDGTIPIAFDDNDIDDSEKQQVLGVASDFNSQMNGCLSVV